MMILRKISVVLAIVTSFPVFSISKHYVGGDISLLPTYEEAGVQYKDQNGNPIELLPYLKEIGMNAMRVRLFVDPESFAESHPNDYDPNACQSLPYIIPLCQDIINNGFDLMLDFHYSDTWADPGAQWIPTAWEGQTEGELAETLYEYTKNTLITLRENGIVPSFIQPGNEITNGMLWAPFGDPDKTAESNKAYNNWSRFGKFLDSAISACREECPEAKIIIHNEQTGNSNNLIYFYDNIEKLNIDYDIIGLSYYPYFHGKISNLNTSLTKLETKYPNKDIMIVETGYPYAWEVPGTNQEVDYAYTEAGQDAYAHELVDILMAHPNTDGLFWWWLEYNPYVPTGPNLEGWYNAPLFNSNGKATPALLTICTFATHFNSIPSISLQENATYIWWDLNGKLLPRPASRGLFIHNNKKVLITK